MWAIDHLDKEQKRWANSLKSFDNQKSKAELDLEREKETSNWLKRADDNSLKLKEKVTERT